MSIQCLIKVYGFHVRPAVEGTDLRAVDDLHFKKVQRHLNNRPVRKFDYLSPIQQTLKHRAVALIT